MWWNEVWPKPWVFIGPMVMLIFVALCVTMTFLMMRGMGHRDRRIDPVDLRRR